MYREGWLARGQKLGMVAVAMALLVSLVVAGCGGSGSSTQGNPSSSGSETTGSAEDAKASSADIPEVVWALNIKEPSLNVDTEPTVETLGLVSNVAEGMLKIEPSGKTGNALASDWEEVSPTEYVYTLKKGPKFSDGKPVTIEDVIYSFEYGKDPKTGGVTSSAYLNVKAIEKDGSDQLKIKLKKPQSDWTAYMANSPTWVFEKSSLEKAGGNFGSASGLPVGSGPYMISEFSNDHVTFVVNPYYDGPKPKAQKVVVKFITDDSTRLAAMESGDIDGSSYVPLTDTPQWESNSSIHLVKAPSPGTGSIYFNMKKTPFDDVHARRAAMYAFNREAVVNDVLHGNAESAISIVNPRFLINELPVEEATELMEAEAPAYTYDIEKAKEELAKSATPQGFSMEIQTDGTKVSTLAGQVWAQNLKEIGIDATVKSLVGSALYETALHGEFSALLTSGGALEGPAPVTSLAALLASEAVPPTGYNMQRFEDPEVDQQIQAAREQSDPVKRGHELIKTMGIVNEEAAQVFVWFQDAVVALDEELVLSDFGPWSLIYTPWMADIKAAG